MENTSETFASHETLSPFIEMVGLQVRLALGSESLDPSKDIGKIDKNRLGEEIAHDTTQKIEVKSVGLRKSYWEERRENEFSAQLASWKKETVSLLSNDQNKDKVGVLSHLEKMGIDFNAFDDHQAQTLYDRYFRKDGDGKIGGFNKFKADVISSYTSEDGVVDYERLNQDLPVIEWFSTIFGIDEGEKEKFLSEIITQSIAAEARVKAEVDKFTDEVNEEKDGHSRGDRLTTHEKELLSYLNNTPLPATQPEEKTTEVKPKNIPSTTTEVEIPIIKGSDLLDKNYEHPWNSIPAPGLPIYCQECLKDLQEKFKKSE